ncbi:interferon-induced very large GTPase 1 [Sigmodon hispidus]
MQLLKVDETFAEECGFDFMLVVDTEGLRAPELNNKSKNWDNELATFVIGLGHLTLINIFGENPSEMQDILQIVVQAFLRMKQVKISPSCIFVHQNVGEVTAKDQTMEGRRRLEQRLDEMTVLAAEQEECYNITRFSDVIKFDVNSHVYYFAHPWDGNPPMAPPNLLYSQNVQELKNDILRTAQQESREKLRKISDVKFRVEDLWKALVSENFIFSFRNTQEVIAMSKLETMYNHWSWELRSHVLDLQNQLNNQIQNAKILTLTTNALEDPLNKKYETIKQDFDKYFEEDPDRETLIQWKANFEQKLQFLQDALISDTRRKGNELISLKRSQERLDNQKSQYENKLLEKSQMLALNMKGKELSDEELHEKFFQVWEQWICDMSSNVPSVTEPNIDLDAENILLEYFKKEKNIVERVKNYSGEVFKINYSQHINVKRGFSVKSLDTCHKESIKKITNNINLSFNEKIENISKQKRDYNQNDFYEILRIIENELKSVPPEEEYTFTRDYNLDFSLYLFQKASKSFKENHEKFKSANCPVNYLKSKKDDFFMSFKISCQGDIKNAILSAIHESTAVAKDKGSTASGWLDLFCDHLGSNLIFPRKDLISIEHQEIKNTEFLKEAMSAALDPALRKVEEDCSSKPIEELVPDIEKILSEHLCGCWKQCPFCKVICTNTIPHHEGDHSVPFHHPQALSGQHYYKIDYFFIDFCTSSVASDNSFILRDLRKFLYKRYREAGGDYATWSITPDSSTQPYWKWFVCRFRSELEEKYQKEFTNLGSIPTSWTQITKQEVLDDLKSNCQNRMLAQLPKFFIN